MEYPSKFTFVGGLFIGGQGIIFHVVVDGVRRVLKWVPTSTYLGKQKERQIYQLLQHERVSNVTKMIHWREGNLSVMDIFEEHQVSTIVELIKETCQNRRGYSVPDFDYTKQRFRHVDVSTIMLFERMDGPLNLSIVRRHRKDIINQLTPTFARLKQLGILHDDISPGNILYKYNDTMTMARSFSFSAISASLIRGAKKS